MRKHSKKVLEQADLLKIDLDYEPIVIMDDIRKLPEEFWHKSRLRGFGGSDEGALHGVGYNSKQMCVTSKIMGVSADNDDEANFRFDYGHMMEALLLKNYALKGGYQFLTYTDYYVVVETSDDVTVNYPFMQKTMDETIYSATTRSLDEANSWIQKLSTSYSPTLYKSQSNEPKDIREITQEEHALYDAKGIVCVDRRQYRHAKYPHVYGDTDGLCILPSGEMIGLECKTYSSDAKGCFASGVYGEDGALKGIDYYYQVLHYMSVLNIDRFDVIACFDNNLNNMTITTVNRDLALEKELMEHCEQIWLDEVEQYDARPNHYEFSKKEAIKIQDMIEKTMKLKGEKPWSKPKIVKLSVETGRIVRDYYVLDVKRLEMQREVKELERKLENLKIEMKERLGEYQNAIAKIDDDSFYISCKEVVTHRLDSKALLLDYPELNSYKKTSESFKFEVKKK